MGFRCGILGLPNAGKSTLFNALAHATIAAEGYPFCTVEPNVGVVPVPDPRLETLAAIARSARAAPASMTFVDVAGLVAGASRGEGLGNRFLGHLREVDALAHVVRCFEGDGVAHVMGRVDPAADVETVETELLLADLDTTERALERGAKAAKAGGREARTRLEGLRAAHRHLADGCPARSLAPDAAGRRAAHELSLLTAKPVMFVANVAEDAGGGEPHLAAVRAIAGRQDAPVASICASVEAEIAALDPDARREFLLDLGVGEPGLDRFVRAGYDLLGLRTFFTTGPKEARAWTVRAGSTAPQAAGRVHGDFERGFIRAEVVAYDDFVACGGEQGAKDAGRWRLEGRDYVIAEGDVVHFRFNV